MVLRVGNKIEINYEDEFDFITNEINTRKNSHKLYFEFYALLEDILNYGAIVKDLNFGLVDFYSKYNSQEIFLNISVVDSINITESVTLNSILNISVSDSITISEDITGTLIHDISVVDSITISENYENTGQLSLSVNDTLNITESDTAESFRFSPGSDRPVGTITQGFAF